MIVDRSRGRWDWEVGSAGLGLRRLVSAAEEWFAGDLASRGPDADRPDSAKGRGRFLEAQPLDLGGQREEGTTADEYTLRGYI